MTGGPEGKPDNIALQQQTVGNHAPRGDELTGTPASEEQKVSWLELFFDLIFVVAFDQLAKRLGANASLANIGIFLLLFTAVWWAWASNSAFAARYGNERRVYRWDTVAELISVALLAVIIRGDLEQTGTYFAVAFGINRLLNAGLHRWADHKTPADVTFSRRTSVVVGTAGLLWLGSALLPSGSGAQLAVWGAALLLDVLHPLLGRRDGQQVLPHQGHLSERVGLLQIIALGEIITEVVNGSRQQTLGWTTLLPAFFSILVAVSLWRLYFDQARALPLLQAHTRGQTLGTLPWFYGHLPLTLSIIMLSVGLGQGIGSGTAEEVATQQQFVVWPLAGALLTLAFLRANSRRVAGERGADRSLVALLLGSAASAALAFVDLDTLQLQGLVAALAVGLAFVVATDPTTAYLGKIEEKISQQLEERDEAPAGS